MGRTPTDANLHRVAVEVLERLFADCYQHEIEQVVGILLKFHAELIHDHLANQEQKGEA